MPKLSKSGDVYVGVDSGASGGLCLLEDGIVKAVSMPQTDTDIADWFQGRRGAAFAVLEKVGGYIMGNKLPGSTMFNFGRTYGLLRMALTMSGIPFEEVTPQKWQKALGIAPKKKTESRTQWKNRLKAKAQQLFPGSRATLKTADAMLIAEYCRRKYEGKL